MINQPAGIQIAAQIFLKTQMSAEHFQKFEDYIKKLESNKSLDSVRTYLFNFVKELTARHGEGHTEAMFEEYIDQMRMLNVPLESYVQNLDLQKFLGTQMWNLLMKNDLGGDYFVLFNYAYLLQINRIELGIREFGTGWMRDLLQIMMRLIDADQAECDSIIKQTWNYNVEGTPLYVKLISGVNDEIVGLLLKLPYSEIAKGQGNKNPDLN